MANPYGSQATESPADSTPTQVWALAALFASAGLIIINNSTSTNEHRDATDVFPEIVFYALPLAMCQHIGVIAGALSNRQLHLRVMSGYTLIASIPLLFVLTLAPLLVGSDYESFVAANRLFGPYGWYRWTWLVLCGILPLLLFVHGLKVSRVARIVISGLAVIGYFHNAWVFWTICH